jgi:YHS domain-containing protein
MNHTRRSLPLAVLLLLIVPATGAAQQQGWFNDYRAARELAASRKSTLLVHIYSRQCGPCMQMEQTVFTDPAVQSALTRGIVAVKIDGSANPTLVKQFGVSGYPADIHIRPGRSPVLRQGALRRDEFLHFLKQIAAPVNTTTVEHSSETPKRPAQVNAPNPRTPPKTNPPDSKDGRKVAGPVVARDDADEPLNSPLIGLQGFCPVTLRQHQKIVVGDARYTAVYQGVRYQFASPQLTAIFRADPDRYAPAVQGCDTVTLARDQKAIQGSILHGTWYAGRLYLFQSAENLQTFKSAPITWSRIRSAQKNDARAHQ